MNRYLFYTIVLLVLALMELLSLYGILLSWHFR